MGIPFFPFAQPPSQLMGILFLFLHTHLLNGHNFLFLHTHLLNGHEDAQGLPLVDPAQQLPKLGNFWAQALGQGTRTTA